MNYLTEDQILLIQHDIQQSGISSNSLQDDLLDHMCCHIEKGLDEGRDFEAAYAIAWQQICPNGLKEIEEAAEVLVNGHRQRYWKRFTYGVGFLSAFLVMMASLFKIFHWPGAGTLAMSAWGLVFLGFLPSFMLYRLNIEQRPGWLGKITYGLGTLGCGMLSTGIFFKFMHWPGANVLAMFGSLGIAFVFLPLLFFHLYRQADRKEMA